MTGERHPRPSPLQREIKQRRRFRSPAEEAVIGLLRTADVVRRRLAVTIEPHGITLQQFNVLRILRGAGPEGLPTLEIADRMIERTPGITRLLDRLEKKGFARRERCPRDRRQVLCHATPASLRLLERLDRPIVEADEAAVGALSATDQKTLIRLLEAIRANRK